MAKIFLTLKLSGTYTLDPKSISFEELDHLYYKPKIDNMHLNAFDVRYIAKGTEDDRIKTTANLALAKLVTIKVNEFTAEKIDALFVFEQSLKNDFYDKILQFGASIYSQENPNNISIESGFENRRMIFTPEQVVLEVFKDKTTLNTSIKAAMTKDELLKSSELINKLTIANEFKHYSKLESVLSHKLFREEYLNDKDFLNYFINGINNFCALPDNENECQQLLEIKEFFAAHL